MLKVSVNEGEASEKPLRSRENEKEIRWLTSLKLSQADEIGNGNQAVVQLPLNGRGHDSCEKNRAHHNPFPLS